ncbi:hypothetical protein AS189_02080 [Arthrobacter alpinus]|uniref:Uncharacterized protein n=1 Tax=Arthrobacter alpinus TaxID=656366 RepID=A0A0S2LVK8_9MICC|nr:hypothetical protein AS189_02080 [Arthrobacter alpinus]
MTVGCGAFDDGAWLAFPLRLPVGDGKAAVGSVGTAGMDGIGPVAVAVGAVELDELAGVAVLTGGVDVQPLSRRGAPATSAKNESLPVRRMAASLCSLWRWLSAATCPIAPKLWRNSMPG